MRRVCLMLFFMTCLFSISAHAYKAKVLEVVPGHEPFAKLDNGEVRFINNKMLLDVGDEVETSAPSYSLEESKYVPSLLNSESEASTILESFRSKARRWSQCYNRAHVWAFEEFNRRGTKLNKTFIFFTNRYIREYRYKWWFHVAPSTVVEAGEEKKELVLDWSYFDEPQDLDDWAKFFVHSGNTCPRVRKFSDYDNHQEEADCYLIKTSMYFWQPLDIENFEKTGVEKTQFISEEVSRAYRQGFSISR
jgi:hypothetical protein